MSKKIPWNHKQAVSLDESSDPGLKPHPAQGLPVYNTHLALLFKRSPCVWKTGHMTTREENPK